MLYLYIYKYIISCNFYEYFAFKYIHHFAIRKCIEYQCITIEFESYQHRFLKTLIQ